jgi:Cd2+/Zn2+-exporting ATPase
MDCAEEVSLLRRQLSEQPGVYDIALEVLQARMVVEVDPAKAGDERIRALVARTGMRAEPWQAVSPVVARSLLGRHWRSLSALVSGACLAAAMILQAARSGNVMESLLLHGESERGLPADVIACCLLAILAGFHWALPKVLASIRNRRPDMNLLVAVSITGACFLGEWSEGATLAFLFSLAALLEAWSLARARSAVTALVELSPAEATVLHSHGERRMPVERIAAGSVVRVKPGERIPCEGEVIAGGSNVDQALVTGESVPVWKEAGSRVWAGTLNCDGALEIRTSREASDTILARIVRMVESSTQRRAPSEQFVERFARYYTPAVFLLAALIGILPPLFAGGRWSYWLYQSMVVLLISCPCALVISTPVSIVSALASAARRGVLIKGGAFLEEAARLKALAFDKTAVLTEGETQVQTFVALNDKPEEEILSQLAGLELHSEHPYARAILRYAELRHVRPAQVDRFQAIEGRGAQGFVGSRLFWVGNDRLLEDRSIDSRELRERLAAFEDSAHTAVVFGAGQEPLAVIGLLDPVRPEASQTIESLRRLGIDGFELLTGDNAATARAVAAHLGLTGARAGLLPEDKAAAVQELRRFHGSVAMIGDGINDAPAMSAASVGIALGRRATDVALETADVILLSGGLERLPFLVRHARRAAGVIRQNVVIALALKAGFLVTAILGAATLWMAIAADMGATLLVTLNGLRLLRAGGRATAPPPPLRSS